MKLTKGSNYSQFFVTGQLPACLLGEGLRGRGVMEGRHDIINFMTARRHNSMTERGHYSLTNNGGRYSIGTS